MKVLVKKIISDQFFSATFWVFIGTGFMNVGNYMYHLLMGRMLGVSLYGALESLISVLYILSVPTMTLTLVIVKFVSSYKGKGDMESIRSLHDYISSKIVTYGLLLVAVLLLLSPLIKNFLHLPSLFLTLLLPIAFLFNLLYFLNKSILQGMSSFFKFSMVNIVESLVKVGLAIVFVYFGFHVEGAFGAIVASILVGLTVAYIYSKGLLKSNIKAKRFTEGKRFLKFTIPTFITTLALISIFTTDVILVRHFFPGEESGYYSALSVLGKIIFFASAPIVLVLFPMASEQHAKGEKFGRLILLSFLLTLSVSIFVTFIYYVIPEVMITILFGEKYIEAAGLLGLFGIFMTLHALCNLFANFYLSIHKTLTSYVVGGFAFLQIFLLYNFHQDLTQIIWVSILTTFLLLISLLLYYPHAKSK